MKISELKKMWEEDSRIDITNLVEAAANVQKLHAKYLGFLMHYRKQLMVEEFNVIMYRKDKFKWYKGVLPEERLKELGWEPFLEIEKSNAAIERRLADDEDMVKKARKREYLKIMISSLETIMKSIGTRGWDIKNVIQMHIYQNGGQ